MESTSPRFGEVRRDVKSSSKCDSKESPINQIQVSVSDK